MKNMLAYYFDTTKNCRFKIVISFALSIISSILLLIQPSVISKIIDNPAGLANFQSLLPVLIILAISSLLNTLYKLWLEKIGERIIANLRNQLISKLYNIKLSELYKHKSSDLANRVTSDAIFFKYILTNILPNVITGTMLIIVTHRLFTMQNADQIVLFDNGRVVGSGSHSELLKDSVLYKRLVLLQELM